MALDIGADRALSRKAMKAELLDAETELQLAYAWKNNRDEQALHRLIRAYLNASYCILELLKCARMVAKQLCLPRCSF